MEAISEESAKGDYRDVSVEAGKTKMFVCHNKYCAYLHFMENAPQPTPLVYYNSFIILLYCIIYCVCVSVWLCACMCVMSNVNYRFIKGLVHCAGKTHCHVCWSDSEPNHQPSVQCRWKINLPLLIVSLAT